jgi:hypothetical protein
MSNDIYEGQNRKVVKLEEPEKAMAYGKFNSKPDELDVFHPEGLTVIRSFNGSYLMTALTLSEADAQRLACAILNIDEKWGPMLQTAEGEKVCLDVWSCADAQKVARDDGYCLTLDQCNKVMEYLEDSMDAEYGLNWNSIRDAIGELGELPTCIHAYPEGMHPEEDEISCGQCEQFNKGKADAATNL